MDFIISLAHFCETHGPTSILCTQVNPIQCSTCCPPSTPPGIQDLTRTSSLTNFFEPPGTPTHNPNAPLLYSPLTSSPTSPRSSLGPHNPYVGEQATAEKLRVNARISSSLNSDFGGDSCENCSFVVPRELRERIPSGCPGSPTKTGGILGTPTLRTTQKVSAYTPIEVTAATQDEVPEERNKDYSCGRYDSHQDERHHLHPPEQNSLDELSDQPLFNIPILAQFLPQETHTHRLTYVSSHHPSVADNYSSLKRTCLRTLSSEKLPKSSPRGPLYFGDPVAGYTIAYPFHIKDPRARGHTRLYALIAMGGLDSWKVSQHYVAVTRIFEGIARDITRMADEVISRETPPRSENGDRNVTPPLSSSLPLPNSIKGHHVNDPRQNKSASTSPTFSSRTPSKGSDSISSRLSDVSSFLSAKRVDADGFGRGSRDVMIPRGLAEITGSEKIFVELHAKFVLLLSQLAGHS